MQLLEQLTVRLGANCTRPALGYNPDRPVLGAPDLFQRHSMGTGVSQKATTSCSAVSLIKALTGQYVHCRALQPSS